MIPMSYRANGSTSNIERVFLYKDSGATAGTEGDPLTGLVYNSTGLIIAVIADTASSVTGYTTTATTIEAVTTLGTYATPTATKIRFKEISSGNAPGLYELQIADAVYATSGAKYFDISITGVADLATFSGRVYLDVMNTSAVVAAVDTALTAYDSASGVVSNTDLEARSIAVATIPTKTDVSDVKDAVIADALINMQVLCRSDAANATDRSVRVDLVNTDNGSGAGTFSVVADSLEAGVTKINGLDLANAGTGGQEIGAA